MARSIEIRPNDRPREKSAMEIILELPEPLRSSKVKWHDQEKRKGTSQREIKRKLQEQLARGKK